MTSDLFGELFVPEPLREAVGGRAWIGAMLEFEAALARAVAPPEAAEAIAAACEPARFDPAEIGRAGRSVGNPAAALVRALTDAVEGEAAGWVHRGATSQDVMDTAAALVARRAVTLVDAELGGVAAACARLAGEHRETLMPARTLLQQALPTTFGLKAAGWLVAVLDARRGLSAGWLPLQLGGAAGTLASLGEEGLRVAERLSEDLDLAQATLPWHTARRPVAELGSALVLAAGTTEKIARDLTLLSQTEVGEVAEAGGGGRGGSSTLPHKRNPVGAALAVACARRARGEASILLDAMVQEHERAAGAWQAEWEALSGALAYTGGAAAALRGALDGLEVRPERMRQNLDPLVMAEAVTTALACDLGRQQAHELVAEAARSGRPLGEALEGRLPAEELDRALDPANYLGSAGALIDRALLRHAEDA